MVPLVGKRAILMSRLAEICATPIFCPHTKTSTSSILVDSPLITANDATRSHGYVRPCLGHAYGKTVSRGRFSDSKSDSCTTSSTTSSVTLLRSFNLCRYRSGRSSSGGCDYCLRCSKTMLVHATRPGNWQKTMEACQESFGRDGS